MDSRQIVDQVQGRFAEAVSAVDLEALEPHMVVEASRWADVASFLCSECGLDYLVCLTSVDRGDQLEAIYNLEQMDAERSGLAVRIQVPRDDPTIPSVEHVWRTADWHEREAFDLMGLQFSGHHNLKRILCAEDWEGHPLRKDYESPDHYHGIRNNVV